MNYKILHIIAVGLFFSYPLAAQKEEDFLEEALEQYAAQTDEVIENDARLQALKYYSIHPLNLNTASATTLKVFFFLNDLQIHAFIQYRKILGPLINIYELQAVPLWDLKTINRLLPYITVEKTGVFSSRYSLPELLQKGNLHLLLRYKRTLEKQRGYKPIDTAGNTHYLGDPNAVYFRMQYKLAQQMNLGITAESDAGEPFSGHGQKGFDFYSFHFYLKNRGILKSLALGDYKINFGQGLINRQGLSFGKTGMVMMIDRSEEIIRPHTSPMEYGFYRGAAIRLEKEKWSTAIFVSKKREDANLLPAKDSSYWYFHGLQKSGYHRSATELSHKGSVNLFSTGGNVRYDFGKGHLAFNLVYHQFSDSLKKSTSAYQRFNPEGYHLLNASIDYAFYLDKLYFFGETATDKNGAFATINGLLMGVDRKVDISLLYRNFSPKYTSLYAKAFGESSRPQNESGFYAGVIFRPVQAWELSAYSDFFRSDWLRYRVDMPSKGKEHFLQIDYRPSTKFKIYGRYRYKVKPINVLTDNPMAKTVDTRKHNIRIFMQWKLSDYFRIRDQTEWTSFKKGKEKTQNGFLFYQNVRWETNQSWNGNFRIAYFNTDSYDSRIYTFENNVRYAYYIPSFFGEGIRTYINFRINIGHHLSLWTRVARTWYFNQNTIGSTWNKIDGNKRTDLTVELIWE